MHDVVPYSSHGPKMFNDLPSVNTQIQPFPVLWFAQESAVSAKGQVCRTGNISPAFTLGCQLHFFNGELSMNQLAQVSLNLADEQERASETHELFGNVGCRHYAGYSIILAPY